jgi:hypothetical protein
MRTQRWIPWMTWCGLVLMGVCVAMQVEARGGGKGGGSFSGGGGRWDF